MIHQRNVSHVCQHERCNWWLAPAPWWIRGLQVHITKLASWAGDRFGSICSEQSHLSSCNHPIHRVEWQTPPSHLSCWQTSHPVLRAWIRLVMCLFSSDIVTSWSYTGILSGFWCDVYQHDRCNGWLLQAPWWIRGLQDDRWYHVFLQIPLVYRQVF